MEKSTISYVAFLGGINVGGHHKVPMADLKNTLKRLKFENIITLLNSGNVIFESEFQQIEKLEKMISELLEKTFGFPIPTILRKSTTIQKFILTDPFKNIDAHKDIRLYVSLLKKDSNPDIELPWTNENESFKILSKSEKTAFSYLDLSKIKTPKAMDAMAKFYGKEMTTRNWNTIKRIESKTPKFNA